MVAERSVAFPLAGTDIVDPNTLSAAAADALCLEVGRRDSLMPTDGHLLALVFKTVGGADVTDGTATVRTWVKDEKAGEYYPMDQLATTHRLLNELRIMRNVRVFVQFLAAAGTALATIRVRVSPL